MSGPAGAKALRRAVELAAARRAVVPGRMQYTVASTIAMQKLHACTGESASGRAHDLIDIQVLAAIEDIDYAEIGRVGQRLFAYRQRHAWPPVVVRHDGWADLYTAALADLDNDAVLPSVDDAVDFTNRLLRAATASKVD